MLGKDFGEIALKRSELEAAGKIINTLHPLRYMLLIFSNEQYKKNISKMSILAWPTFKTRLAASLATEAKISNMSEEFLDDMLKHTKLDLRALLPLYRAKKWDRFISACAQR